MPALRHEDLIDEIRVLDGRLLGGFGKEFPLRPTLQDIVPVNAYLVLAHGCIEEFLETLFEQHTEELATRELVNIAPRTIAMAAFAWHDLAKNSKNFDVRTLEDIVQSGPEQIRRAVNGNNGIKEANLKKLAQASGVEWPAFEAKCNGALTQLATLGAKRGSVAHVSTSRTVAVETPFTPAEARNWVEEAAEAARGIELYLRGLRRRAVPDTLDRARKLNFYTRGARATDTSESKRAHRVLPSSASRATRRSRILRAKPESGKTLLERVSPSP